MRDMKEKEEQLRNELNEIKATIEVKENQCEE